MDDVQTDSHGKCIYSHRFSKITGRRFFITVTLGSPYLDLTVSHFTVSHFTTETIPYFKSQLLIDDDSITFSSGEPTMLEEQAVIDKDLFDIVLDILVHYFFTDSSGNSRYPSSINMYMRPAEDAYVAQRPAKEILENVLGLSRAILSGRGYHLIPAPERGIDNKDRWKFPWTGPILPPHPTIVREQEVMNVELFLHTLRTELPIPGRQIDVIDTFIAYCFPENGLFSIIEGISGQVSIYIFPSLLLRSAATAPTTLADLRALAIETIWVTYVSSESLLTFTTNGAPKVYRYLEFQCLLDGMRIPASVNKIIWSIRPEEMSLIPIINNWVEGVFAVPICMQRSHHGFQLDMNPTRRINEVHFTRIAAEPVVTTAATSASTPPPWSPHGGEYSYSEISLPSTDIFGTPLHEKGPFDTPESKKRKKAEEEPAPLSATSVRSGKSSSSFFSLKSGMSDLFQTTSYLHDLASKIDPHFPRMAPLEEEEEEEEEDLPKSTYESVAMYRADIKDISEERQGIVEEEEVIVKQPVNIRKIEDNWENQKVIIENTNVVERNEELGVYEADPKTTKRKILSLDPALAKRVHYEQPDSERYKSEAALLWAVRRVIHWMQVGEKDKRRYKVKVVEGGRWLVKASDPYHYLYDVQARPIMVAATPKQSKAVNFFIFDGKSVWNSKCWGRFRAGAASKLTKNTYVLTYGEFPQTIPGELPPRYELYYMKGTDLTERIGSVSMKFEERAHLDKSPVNKIFLRAALIIAYIIQTDKDNNVLHANWTELLIRPLKTDTDAAALAYGYSVLHNYGVIAQVEDTLAFTLTKHQ